VIASPLEPSGLEVTELAWERIQLVLRIRRKPGAVVELDEGSLFLRLPDGRHEPLPARPARGSFRPDERGVRFNPFAGADQMPLDSGSWEVVVRRPGAEPEWLSVPIDAERFVAASTLREFLFGRSMYRIKIRATDDGRPLAVEVSTWNRAVRRKSLLSVRPIRGWWRELMRRAWIQLFGLLVSGLHALPRHGPVIVFTSDSREALGGNLKLVHDRMVERGLDRQYRFRMLFRASLRVRRSFADRVRLVWLLARAEIILLEDYQPAVHRLPRRPEQRIIQLWHAWGAFKTVGYSRIGKPGGLSPYSRVHKNYTYATVSSTHEVPFYAEAFGLPEERIAPTGTPRMDEFLDPQRQVGRRTRAYDAIPAARDREVILFAPTFRGAGARRAHYPVELIDGGVLHQLCEERDAIVIVKMHPFVRRTLEVPEEYQDRLVDAGSLPVETNDLLLIADLLVTDYSSLVFEYAALGRPMLFFAYDLERYVASRDFYEPYESFVPGRIVRTFDELVEAIRSGEYQAEKVAPFARRHLPESPGSATDRIIDELIVRR
jgi:CDP-glycerol glycerophosphotransferase (TagB/SpsB family)